MLYLSSRLFLTPPIPPHGDSIIPNNVNFQFSLSNNFLSMFCLDCTNNHSDEQCTSNYDDKTRIPEGSTKYGLFCHCVLVRDICVITICNTDILYCFNKILDNFVPWMFAARKGCFINLERIMSVTTGEG